MSDCRHVVEQLPEFVAAELPPAAMAALRQHLHGCNGCRQQASLHLQARRALRTGVSLPGVDEAFFTDLGQQVMRRVAEPEPGGVRGWRRQVGAAAAVAMFGLGVWFVQSGEHVGMLGRDVPAVAPAVPVPMPWAGSRALRDLGSFSPVYTGADASSALSTQGMMGRAMLPHFVEVDMLGLSTLTLDTRVPKPDGEAEAMPPSRPQRPR